MLADQSGQPEGLGSMGAGQIGGEAYWIPTPDQSARFLNDARITQKQYGPNSGGLTS